MDKKSETKTFKVDSIIIVAIIGFLSNSIITYINNGNTNDLEQRKFETELIKKALEEHSQEDKLKSLKLLTTLHLINNSDLEKALNTFLKDTILAKEALPSPVKSYVLEEADSYLSAIINKDTFLQQEEVEIITSFSDTTLLNKIAWFKVSIEKELGKNSVYQVFEKFYQISSPITKIKIPITFSPDKYQLLISFSFKNDVVYGDASVVHQKSFAITVK
jgi:hypothetical protein